MNLADMLSYADIGVLTRIAKTYDCTCSVHSKNELIQSILTTIGRREVFESHIRSLPIEDIRLLNSLLFDPRESFSLEELAARVKQTVFDKEAKESVNPRETIARFKQKGWLFNGFSQQTKYLFHMPNDLKLRFSDTLSTMFFAKLEVCADSPGAYREEQQLMLDDMLQLQRCLFEQEVTLNAEGFMYKRYLQQMLESMNVVEEQISRSAWRFGYGRRFKEYPSRFSLMYDYAYFHGLIQEDGQTLRLSEEGRNRVLEAKKEDPRQIYQFWLKLYKGAVPNLQSIVNWIERLARPWVTAASLQEALGTLIKPYYYDSPQSIFEQRVLQMMMHQGLVRIGEHEKYGRVVQISKLGSGIIRGTFVPEEERIELKFDKA